MLVDETDPSDTPSVLVYLEHAIVDGRPTRAGNRRVVSKQFEFVEVDPDGTRTARRLGAVPRLPPSHTTRSSSAASPDHRGRLGPRRPRVKRSRPRRRAGPSHLDEVRRRTLDRVERTDGRCARRLHAEIQYWDHRANELKEHELAGKLPKSGMNSAKARQRADELQARLKRRSSELDAERQLSPLPPVVSGGALVIPPGCSPRMLGAPADEVAESRTRDARVTERVAVDAVLAAERASAATRTRCRRTTRATTSSRRTTTGRSGSSRSRAASPARTRSRSPAARSASAATSPTQHILALAEVADAVATDVRYVRQAFEDVGDLPFDTISVNLQWKPYFERGEVPA